LSSQHHGARRGLHHEYAVKPSGEWNVLIGQSSEGY
jgi:hypothetical protein